MFSKLFFCQSQIRPSYSQPHEDCSAVLSHSLLLIDSHGHDEFYSKVDNLNPTEDGEAGEEPHGAADETNLGGQSHLHIPFNLVIGGRVKVDLD